MDVKSVAESRTGSHLRGWGFRQAQRQYLRDHLRDSADDESWAPLFDRLAPGVTGSGAADLLAVLGGPRRLRLAVTYLLDGNDAALLLPDPEPEPDGESAPAYRDRLTSLLLDQFVPAATRLYPRPGHNAEAYDPAQVYRWMHTLATHLAQQRSHPSSGRSGTDLTLSSVWPVAGEVAVRRLHGLVNGVVFGAAVVGFILLSGLPQIFIRNWTSPVGILIATQVTFVSVGWTYLVAYSGATRPPARISLRRARAAFGLLHTARGRRTVLRKLMIALFVAMVAACEGGALFGVIGWLVNAAPAKTADAAAARPSTAAVALFGAVATGVLAAIFMRLDGKRVRLRWPFRPRPVDAIDASVAVAAGPRDALRDSGQSGLVCALIAAVVLGSLMWQVGPGRAVIAAVLAAAATFLLAGSLAVRYLLGVGLAAAAGALPTRLGQFLDWACEAGLLRVAGTAYQFRHEELQSWLESHGC